MNWYAPYHFKVHSVQGILRNYYYSGFKNKFGIGISGYVPKNLEDDFLLKNPDLRAESIVFYALKDQVEKEGINLNIFYDNSFISNWKDKEFDGQNDFICWSERRLIILDVIGGLLSCEDG